MKRLSLISALLGLSVILLFSCGKKAPPPPLVVKPVSLSLLSYDSLSVKIAWTKSENDSFDFYIVDRFAIADLPILNSTGKSPLIEGLMDSMPIPTGWQWLEIAKKYDRDDTIFVDTTVTPVTHYFYQVIVSASDILSPPSDTVELQTLNLSGCSILFVPRVAWIEPNDWSDVSVMIVNVEDLFGASFEIAYSPSVIKFESISPGSWFGEDLIFFTHDSAGVLSVAITKKRGSEPLNGTGEILRLRVRAQSEGISPLNFVDSTLTFEDPGGNLIGIPNPIEGWIEIK